MSLTVKWKSRLETTRTIPRRIWMYKNADFSRACDLIQQTDWECLLSDDVDRSTKLWTKRLLDIMEECVPQRVLQNRKQTCRFNKYKRMRNKVTAMLRSAKQKYFDSLSTAGNKKFWKTVKLLNKQQVSIPTLQEDGVSAVTDEEKSNMLNEYFSKCWNHSEPLLSDSFVKDPVEQDDSTVDLLCSTDEIIHLIQGLDITKANGPDGISARMLTASSIAPSLTKLFNLSISRGHFPTPWKGARVVPIPKSSSAKCSPSGYRPISLLSVLSKLLEKHFFSLITEHLDEHHPLSPAQWGFQKGKSTITALLSATHDWLSQLDQNKDICCVFFDFQKAFDTVPHKSLMERLSQLDLHPLILRWIHSYLRRREQHVVVNGAASQSIPVISGVPQGSVLGPLLFLVYIDSISLLQLSEGRKLSLYADDMLLYKTISSDADRLYQPPARHQFDSWLVNC